MPNKPWQHWSGALGLGLVFVALFLPGRPPKTDDTVTALTANLIEHRTALVDGMLIAGLGVMALLWFFGVLANTLRRDTQSASYAHAAFAGGLAGTLLVFVGMLLFSGTAFRAAGMADQTLVRATVDTGNMLIETGKYGFAVLILATCAAASHSNLLSRRMILIGVTAATILALSTIPPFLADHGVGQFGGGIDVLGGIPGFVWIFALSVQLARRTDLTSS
jgi:hypothetical protein